MSDLRARAGGPCHPWGPVASLGWAMASVVVWILSQIVFGNILANWFSLNASQIGGHAPLVALVTIASAVAPLLLIRFAIRRAGCAPAEYLGLGLPDRRYLVFGLASLAVILPVVDFISWAAGYPVTPQFVIDLYVSARDNGALLLTLLALVVAAPLIEEIVFRGFLLPGLAASAIGPAGAIVLTSGIWAALHAQYQPFYLIQIMVLGALFGWLRLRSGSTALTIILHGVLNLAAMVQAAAVVEWS